MPDEPLLSDEEINAIILKVSKREGFNKKEGYHRTHANEYVRETIKYLRKLGYLSPAEVKAIKEEYQARIDQLKAGKLTYCAYCGEEFPIDAEGTPQAVSEHIANCPKHPIHDYKERIIQLEQEVKAREEQARKNRPEIVCLCGSGRFKEAFDEAEYKFTLEGKIVLTIGCNTHDIAREKELAHYKPMLDELHKRKIDLADEVFIVNVGGYIGESTRGEIEYATKLGKPIKYLVALSGGKE